MKAGLTKTKDIETVCVDLMSAMKVSQRLMNLQQIGCRSRHVSFLTCSADRT